MTTRAPEDPLAWSEGLSLPLPGSQRTALTTPPPFPPQVVVKIQRPGLKALFDIDLKNVRALAVWLQKVDPKTDGAARDWVAIYDECSRILYQASAPLPSCWLPHTGSSPCDPHHPLQEIDYRLEGKNADLFRANFAGTDWVRVPKVRARGGSASVGNGCPKGGDTSVETGL